MKVINCCNHKVEICDADGKIIKTYKPSGHWARVGDDARFIGYVDGIPVKVRENRRVVGLPEPEEDTYYIVSNILLQECPDRKDLLACGGKWSKYNPRSAWTAFVTNG